MAAAREARETSHDPHHQVGCVAIARDGRRITSANRVPGRLRCDVPERLERSAKQGWIAHAEALLVCDAARAGISLEGATVFTTRFPCDGCALVLVASGIVEVVSPAPDFDHPRWGASFRSSVEKFAEAGVVARRPIEADLAVAA